MVTDWSKRKNQSNVLFFLSRYFRSSFVYEFFAYFWKLSDISAFHAIFKYFTIIAITDFLVKDLLCFFVIKPVFRMHVTASSKSF